MYPSRGTLTRGPCPGFCFLTNVHSSESSGVSGANMRIEKTHPPLLRVDPYVLLTWEESAGEKLPSKSPRGLQPLDEQPPRGSTVPDVEGVVAS